MINSKTQTFLKEVQGPWKGACPHLGQLPPPEEHIALPHPLGSGPFHKFFSLLGIPFPFSNLEASM